MRGRSDVGFGWGLVCPELAYFRGVFPTLKFTPPHKAKSLSGTGSMFAGSRHPLLCFQERLNQVICPDLSIARDRSDGTGTS